MGTSGADEQPVQPDVMNPDTLAPDTGNLDIANPETMAPDSMGGSGES
jgi:hypothetical protein